MADGSVGWCCFIAGSLSLFTAWLENPVARELFGTPPTLRGAGSFRPLGTARITDGGYVVSGQWDFASGCLHSNWLALNCVVADDSGPRMNIGGPLDGTPQLRMMTVSIEDARVIDNWSVIGLHGTGSNDVAVTELFVPGQPYLRPHRPAIRHGATVPVPLGHGCDLYPVGGAHPGPGARSHEPLSRSWHAPAARR